MIRRLIARLVSKEVQALKAENDKDRARCAKLIYGSEEIIEALLLALRQHDEWRTCEQRGIDAIVEYEKGDLCHLTLDALLFADSEEHGCTIENIRELAAKVAASRVDSLETPE